MIQIPVTTDPAQVFTTLIGDVKAVFDIQWNDRTQLFSLTLSNEDTEQVYVQGQPIVLGVDMLEAYVYGIGSLVAIDTTKQGKEATVDTLGDTVLLYWFSEDEAADAINTTV